MICYRKKIKPLFLLWHPVYVCHSDCCHFYLSLASAGEVSIFVYLWLSTDVCCHGNSTGKRLQILLLNSWSRSALVLKLCRSIFFWWQHYAMWRDLLHFIVSVCVCVCRCVLIGSIRSRKLSSSISRLYCSTSSLLIYLCIVGSHSLLLLVVHQMWVQYESIHRMSVTKLGPVVFTHDVSHQARSCSFYTGCQPSSSVL